MPRFSLWNIKKGKDYKFIDKTLSQLFFTSGTSFLVHKYIGIYDQGETDDKTMGSGDGSLVIQDLLLLENRDRKYDPNIYDLRGVYNVQANEVSIIQFGAMLTADTLILSFHLNDMIDLLGRKIMPGDVLEVPHLRDDATLDDEDDGISTSEVVRKFYKVDDAIRSEEGFSQTWWHHIWKVTVSPLTDSQEFRDILDRDAGSFNGDGIGDGEDIGKTMRDLISTFSKELEISDSIIEQAEINIPNRNTEHAHLYVSEENDNGIPYLFMTDAEPPNGAELLGCGDTFPDNVTDGDWFLRTDYVPNVLFKYESQMWIRKEVDWKEKWTTANRVLEKFVNNRNKTPTSQGMIDSKIGVSQIVKPKARTPDLDY